MLLCGCESPCDHARSGETAEATLLSATHNVSTDVRPSNAPLLMLVSPSLARPRRVLEAAKPLHETSSEPLVVHPGGSAVVVTGHETATASTRTRSPSGVQEGIMKVVMQSGRMQGGLKEVVWWKHRGTLGARSLIQ